MILLFLVDLASGVSVESLMKPILSNPDFASRLQEFLPTIGETRNLPPAEQIRDNITSPQFNQVRLYIPNLT